MNGMALPRLPRIPDPPDGKSAVRSGESNRPQATRQVPPVRVWDLGSSIWDLGSRLLSSPLDHPVDTVLQQLLMTGDRGRLDVALRHHLLEGAEGLRPREDAVPQTR